MAFYKSISDHYDNIFPLNPMPVEFVRKSFLNISGLEVLDVGCGTGSMCMALAPHFKKVTGIEPDDAMLKLAVEKAGPDHGNLSFHPFGMLDLEKQFHPHSFDAILCFGNTLVHLGSAEEILDFLAQAKKVLKPGGKLLMQIINYDRIFRENIKALPTIENESIKFVRNYHDPSNEKLLDFETILTVKSSGEEIRNVIQLFAVQKDALETMLFDAGFSKLHFYGNFKRDPFQADSIPLIIEATIS